MRISFDSAANDDLDSVFAWIAKDDVPAAYETMLRIEAQIARLETAGLEDMGRPGLIEGTRELVEHPYIVVYRVIAQHDEIIILSVVHTSQDR